MLPSGSKMKTANKKMEKYKVVQSKVVANIKAVTGASQNAQGPKARGPHVPATAWTWDFGPAHVVVPMPPLSMSLSYMRMSVCPCPCPHPHIVARMSSMFIAQCTHPLICPHPFTCPTVLGPPFAWVLLLL